MRFIILIFLLIFTSCTSLKKHREESYFDTKKDFEISELKISKNISQEEYMILSLLSYADFKKEHINNDLYSILEKDYDNLINKFSIFSILNLDNKKKEFIEYYGDFLKKWSLLDTSDFANLNNLSSIEDGFYSAAFINKDKTNNKTEVVVAYRGSEFFPLTAAYYDFVRTNLFIGAKSKPKQFEKGSDFYRYILHKYSPDEVSMTGHSLGGGIAQYTAFTARAVENKILPTITFNAIGIFADNIIKITDMIDLKSYIEKDPNIKDRTKKYSNIIENVIKTEIFKDLDINKFLESGNINFKKHDKKISSLSTKLKIAIIDKISDKELDYIAKSYYNEIFLTKVLNRAYSFYKDFISNENNENIINIVHSKDFTGNYFPHLGWVYILDKNSCIKYNYISSYQEIKNLEKISKNKMLHYHQFNVFIPFLKRNNFQKKINKNYNFFYINLIYSKDSQLKTLYEQKKIGEFKKNFLEKLSKNNNIIFKNVVLEAIFDIKIDEFEKILYIDEKNDFNLYNIWYI